MFEIAFAAALQACLVKQGDYNDAEYWQKRQLSCQAEINECVEKITAQKPATLADLSTCQRATAEWIKSYPSKSDR